MTAKTRMYILVRDRVPLGFAAVSIAHAALSCFLKFKDEPYMQKWLAESYRKCVCSVTDAQFEAAKAVKNNVLVTESGYGGTEIALAFCPRPSKKWPREFETFALYDAPFREGDKVVIRTPGFYGGCVGRIDALNGWQDRPAAVRVDVDGDCAWYKPHELRRVVPSPESLTKTPAEFAL